MCMKSNVWCKNFKRFRPIFFSFSFPKGDHSQNYIAKHFLLKLFVCGLLLFPDGVHYSSKHWIIFHCMFYKPVITPKFWNPLDSLLVNRDIYRYFFCDKMNSTHYNHDQRHNIPSSDKTLHLSEDYSHKTNWMVSRHTLFQNFCVCKNSHNRIRVKCTVCFD